MSWDQTDMDWKKEVQDKQILEAYPIRNCEHELNDGLVTVLFVKKKLNIIERTFFKKISSKPYKIDLDEIGSYIWHLCDGKNSVDSIITIARDHFEEKIEPAEERIVKFIERNDNYGYSYLFDGLMRHKQYTLFNALQCE